MINKTINKQDISPISKEIIEYKKQNLCLSGANIAKKFRKSRERIRQILFHAGIETKSLKTILRKICPQCKGEKKSEQRICSQCKKKELDNLKILVACTACGKLNLRSAKGTIRQINKRNSQYFFCNRKCFGSWMGKKYGFSKTKKPAVFIRLKCITCSKEFNRNVKRVGNPKNYYCSDNCYYKRGK